MEVLSAFLCGPTESGSFSKAQGEIVGRVALEIVHELLLAVHGIEAAVQNKADGARKQRRRKTESAHKTKRNVKGTTRRSVMIHQH